MMKKKKKNLSIAIPEELHQKLSALAKESSRPLSAYIRQVLKAHLQYLDRVRKP